MTHSCKTLNFHSLTLFIDPSCAFCKASIDRSFHFSRPSPVEARATQRAQYREYQSNNFWTLLLFIEQGFRRVAKYSRIKNLAKIPHKKANRNSSLIVRF